VTSVPATGHNDGNIDVANVGYPLDKTKGTAGSTCSAASCHADPYSVGTITTPVWGTTGNGCAACHSGINVITAVGPDTGSHVVHNNTTCTDCHAAGTTATSKPGSGHLDGTITVTNSYPATAKHAAGSYTGTCSNTYCHGTSSPAWGAVGSLNCESCHSASNALPGAHSIHSEAASVASSYTNMSGNVSDPGSYRFSCAACHKGKHANGPANANGSAEVFFGFTSATMKGSYIYGTTQGSPVDKSTFTWSAGGVGCTTTYCHSDGNNTNGAAAVAWTTTASSGTCDQCHGNSSNLVSGSHEIHAKTNALGCVECHAKTVSDNTTISDKSKHVNKFKDYSGIRAGGSDSYDQINTTCSAAACHANVYGTGSVVTPSWGSTGNGCSACHMIPIDATGPATGSHVSHNDTTCSDCHAAGTTATSKPTTGHIDGTITVTNSYPVTAKHTAGSYIGSCSTASCHADPYSAGTIVSPVWGTTAGCSACHTGANVITATGPATGSHTNVISHAVACTICHAIGTSATTVPSVGHADGNIDVANVGYPLDKTKGTVASTCSTASCHASPYIVGGFITTPVWGTTGNGCAACHTGANVITANGPATGNHTNISSHKVACTTCHAAGTSAASAPATGHADGNIDVANVGYPLDKTKGSAAATCSAASCHADPYSVGGFITTPTWGTAPTGSCAVCHSGANVITVNGPATGSHTNTVGHAVACTSCHATGTSATSVPAVGHGDGNIDVVNVGYPMDKTKGSAAITCSAASCHANPYSVGGFVTTPVWGTSGNGCSACHTGANVITANGPATGNHTNVSAHKIACTTCHAAGTSATTAPSLANGHNDGNIDVVNVGYPADKTKGTAGASCTTTYCHGASSPTWGSVGVLTCESCHSASNALPGAHQIHVTTAAVASSYTNMSGNVSTPGGSYRFSCAACHKGQHANGVANANGSAEVFFGFTSSTMKGTYAYGGTSLNDSKNFAWSQGGGAGCNTTYCHSNGNGANGAAAVAWTTTASSGTCNQCHGNDAATLTSGSHALHLTTNANAYGCVDCHATTVSNNTTIKDTSKHVNKFKDYSSIRGGGSDSYNLTIHTCSAAACHANVYGTGSVLTPAWGSTAGCNACHTTPIAATGPATGSHVIHNDSTCTDCHAAGTTATSKPTSGHLDGTITVTNGYPATAKHAANSGYTGTCSAVSCHANVYGTGSVVTPVWGTPSGCSACHTVTIGTSGPATGSHTTHARSATCVDCHAAGTTATSAPTTGHKDGTITVSNGYPVTVKHTADTGFTGTCSTATCHADPYVVGGFIVTPVWGTTPGCVACHAGANVITANGPATGSHTNTAGHAVACVSCHAPGTTATIPPTHADGHADGNIDVFNVGYAILDKTKGTAGATCSAASCHANVYGTGSVTTPAWGSTGNGCNACHTTPIGPTGPATAGHVTHNNSTCIDCHNAGTTATSVPSNGHNDGIITVNNGYPVTARHAAGSYTGTCSTAICHSNVYGAGTIETPVWGTLLPLTCNACHTGANVITAIGPATGSHVAHNDSTCIDCHNAGTTATTKPSTAHLDGAITVTNGYPATAKHAANSGYIGTCSTAACHNDPYSTGKVTTPVWGTASGCSACHTVPIGVNGPATGSHVAHAAALCSACHNAGTTATTAPATGHNDNVITVNNAYTVTVKHTANSGYGTCSTASCHANPYSANLLVTPVWGVSSDCSACHSVPIGVNGPATGSHTAHAGAACVSCHNAGTTATTMPSTGHADGTITVTNGYPITAKHTANSGYTGTCSSASCHSNPYSAGVVTSPVWGTAAGCSSCHTIPIAATGPATGSHAVHNDTTCTDCHNAGATATTAPAVGHADGFVTVTNGYPALAKHAAGSGYGTCSTAICHGSGVVTWGSPLWSTTDQCGKCHSSAAAGAVTAATPFYSTSFPVKNTDKNNAKVGAHTAHITASEGLHPGLACIDCHGTVDHLTDASHVKGVTTFNWSVLAKTGGLNPSYDPATGKCSNIYCHGSKILGIANGGSNNTPSWNDPAYLPATLTVASCGTCHGFPPLATTGHPVVTIPTGFPDTAAIGGTCNCHPNINQDTSVLNSYANIFVDKTKHINGTVEGGECNKCHGYPPMSVSAGLAGAGTQNNWSSAKTEDYSGGGGVHTINGHISKTASFNDGFGFCVKCHTQSDHKTAVALTPSQNIKVNVDQRFRMESSKQARYTSNRLDGNLHIAGNCSNISCHFGATPPWN
jgi:predicted CxxxxCH...CXXCH cytochrome family protein